MKIVLIGPGCMPIPSPGWGAVERIVWDYYQVLSSNIEDMGHEVHIINTPHHHQRPRKMNLSMVSRLIREVTSQGTVFVFRVDFEEGASDSNPHIKIMH